MKTIEQAATEYADKDRVTRSEHSAFVAGVIFAQRWISLEDELPEECIPVLIKDSNDYVYAGCMFRIDGEIIFRAAVIIGQDYNIDNASYWRYIELK